jgi:uncharacterized protein
MDYSEEIEIIIKAKNFDPKGKILVSGFHSALGETGYIVLRHLTAQADAQLVGYITSPLLPPHVFLSKNRLLLPIELYSFQQKFILLFTRLQPHRAEWAPFAEAIAQWAFDAKVKECLLLGGLDQQFAEGGEQYRTAYTTAYKTTAEQYNLPLLEEGRGIYGPLALLLANFEILDFPAVAILPYAERGRPDPRAASIAVDVVNRLYNLEISTQELMEDAENIEAEIKQLLERQRDRENDRGPGGMFV